MTESRSVVYECTERQSAFHAAPEMFKLYGGAMGGGKSMALCAEAIALSCDYPGNRGYLCRHELTSFRRTTLLTLIDLLDKAHLIAKHHQTENYFVLPNGSVIYYGGLGDDHKAIERLKSMELGWFGIDEASETVESFFLMLASRLRLKIPNIRYFGLLATNPDPGWIKVRFIDTKSPDHIFVPALPKDNPHLPADYVGRLTSIFPEEWQARFINGDWGAFEGVNNVFPYQAILAAQARKLEESEPRELGVDVARYGDDKTDIAARRGPVVRIVKELAKTDLMTATGEVVVAKRAEGATAIKVDADGLGSGMVDRLREQKHEVIELHGGGKPNDSERFRNAKAEWYWGFRERLIAGDVDLDAEDLELAAQLTSCTYRITSGGQLEIIPKEDMKKKGLKSPDKAEAVIYAFASNPGGGVYLGFSEASFF
jgi:phage terminase large subunit